MGSVAVVVGGVDVALAVVFIALGIMGIRRMLPRNRWVGIRTSLTLRSDATFATAHAVAGPGLIGAGSVAGLGGALGLVGASTVGLVFALVGAGVGLVLLGVAASFGLRAAARVPDAEDISGSGCGSQACGSCVLAGGCSTASH